MDRERTLSSLDWIGVGLCLFFAIGLVFWPFTVAPAFGSMFEDFGGALPAATLLALHPAPPIIAALLGLLLVGGAIATRRDLGKARILIVVAFFETMLAGGALVAAMYLPLWELSANIQ